MLLWILQDIRFKTAYEIFLLNVALATYEVYNAVDNTLLASTTDLSFTHSDLINGTEYCYYIKTVYDEGSSESTETGCGTPNSWEPAPPTNVYAEVWDEEVSLYWTSQM